MCLFHCSWGNHSHTERQTQTGTHTNIHIHTHRNITHTHAIHNPTCCARFSGFPGLWGDSPSLGLEILYIIAVWLLPPCPDQSDNISKKNNARWTVIRSECHIYKFSSSGVFKKLVWVTTREDRKVKVSIKKN